MNELKLNLNKKHCKGITLDKKVCKKDCIKHAFNKDTGKKYNLNYCQMHQPIKIIMQTEISILN